MKKEKEKRRIITRMINIIIETRVIKMKHYVPINAFMNRKASV